MTKPEFKNAWPYQQDAMNLPVNDLEIALPFYETVMGFQVMSRADAPVRTAVLKRDAVTIGLSENGGDPTQDGCFFEVSDLVTAQAELTRNGLEAAGDSAFSTQKHGETTWQVFFVVAPDGLCYCLGERQA